jgi:uncharacterized RDD family membrane protein YckC
MELNLARPKEKQEKSLFSIQNAGIFQRLIAFLVDAILVFFLHFTFSLAVISPVSNQFGYQQLVTDYNAQLVEFHLGEYSLEDGSFIMYNMDEIDEADLQAFYDDPEAKEISTRKFIFDFVQVSVGLLLAELVVLMLMPLLLKNGQTLGKKLMRLGLVDNQGLKVKPINVVMRFLIGWFVFETALSLIMTMFVGLPLFILISALMALLTRNKRALHDIIGSTIVVNLDKMILFETTEERKEAMDEDLRQREMQSHIE